MSTYVIISQLKILVHVLLESLFHFFHEAIILRQGIAGDWYDILLLVILFHWFPSNIR